MAASMLADENGAAVFYHSKKEFTGIFPGIKIRTFPDG